MDFILDIIAVCVLMPLCNPMEGSPPGSSFLGISKNTGAGCQFLLQPSYCVPHQSTDFRYVYLEKML